MNLYIRQKPRWINFIHNVQELKQFEFRYLPNTSTLIGDLANFNKPMISMLLKFLEENSMVDCYSSRDINNPILLSRFVHIYKSPISLSKSYSFDNYMESDCSYSSAFQYLDSLSLELKLRSPLFTNKFRRFIQVL